MQALLKQQGLWAPLTKDKNGMDANSAEYKTMEEKAHSMIMLCLADDVITEVADQETAAALWLKLESLYMTKSLTSKLMLKQRLFSLRMSEGTPLREHLDQLNTILLDLRNIDEKVSDEDAALILLVSLPLSYENFVQSFIVGKDCTILARGAETPPGQRVHDVCSSGLNGSSILYIGPMSCGPILVG